MSDFLGEVVGRALGAREVVRPRLASTFEPGPAEFLAAADDRPGATVSGQAPSLGRPAPARSPAAVAAPSGVAPAQDEEPRQRSGPASHPSTVATTSAGAEPSPVAPEVVSRMASPPPKDAELGEPDAAPPRERPDPAVVAPSGPSETVRADSAPAAASRLVESRVVERQAIEAPRRPGSRVPARGERPHAEAEAGPEPVVHVHIGRIEVRAPAQPGPAVRAPKAREPNLSLADYLAQSDSGRR